MAAVEGISGFFNYLGAKARYFDLGRRIQPITRDAFERADRLESPYPFPYLRAAWLGVVFWTEENKQSPMVWSLKLPLDERNQLEPGDRDRFLQQLLLSLGSNIQAAQAGKQLSAVLDNNPYAFKLPEDRQAAFHAKVSAVLKRPASRFQAATLEYLQNPTQDGWQNLGIQGLADVAARWQVHEKLLLNSLPQLPPPAFIGLAQLLEHEAVTAKLAQALINRLIDEVAQPSPNQALVAAAIRGLSFSQATGLRQQALIKALALLQEANVEVVAAVASRCPEDLANAELGMQFLELLASLGHENFIRVLTDLLALPELRPNLLEALRQPNRSATLAGAIGEFFSQLQQASKSGH